MSLKRDMQDLVAEVRAAGWTVTYTGAGHWRCQGPAGGLVFCASTPTDSRAVRNARTQLRKAGLDLTQRTKRN